MVSPFVVKRKMAARDVRLGQTKRTALAVLCGFFLFVCAGLALTVQLLEFLELFGSLGVWLLA
mgnify:CR=1 FL=1